MRISWEEALDLVTAELLRVKQTYGTTAILSQSDQHGETKCVHGPHGCMRKLLKLIERVVDMHEERSRLRRAKQH